MPPSSDTRTFALLTEFLEEHEPLWRERPFVQQHLSWEETHPHLVKALLNLSDAELDEAEEFPGLLRHCEGFGPLCSAVEQLSHVEVVPLGIDNHTPPLFSGRQLPARKSIQISYFRHAANELLGTLSGNWVEWCSGKGHLGRALLQEGCHSMLSFERNPSLVKKGRSLAQSHQANQRFLEVDVLSQPLENHLKGIQGIASLHACGTLTDRVLEVAISNAVSSVVASPCCYHAGVGEKLQLKSAQGKKVHLSLSGEELRLVTAEVVVARQSLRRRRIQQMGWRLSLDKWVRQSTGMNTYTRQGSYSAKDTGGSFQDFMGVACARMGVSLPLRGYAELEKWGHARASNVRRMSLLRGLFRRVLEKWINLDRVLHLQENGRSASLYAFCGRNHSPRNHLIVGQHIQG